MSPRTRGILGLLFVVAAVAAAFIGLSSSWDSIVDVAADLPWWRVALPFPLVLVGVATTGLVWSLALARCGHPVPVGEAAPIFFMGQIGKYLPGSVWSFGAVAVMLRRQAVPVSTSIASSLLFLVLHFAPGLVLTGALVLDRQTRLPAWSGALIALAGLALLTPQILRPTCRLLNRGGSFEWSWTDSLAIGATMAFVWSVYTVALVLTVSHDSVASAPTVMAAFVLAFAAGVAIPFAPAGVGVRESVLIYLLSPSLGFEVAAAVALLSRVTHTVADVVLATASAAWTRRPTARS